MWAWKLVLLLLLTCGGTYQVVGGGADTDLASRSPGEVDQLAWEDAPLEDSVQPLQCCLLLAQTNCRRCIPLCCPYGEVRTVTKHWTPPRCQPDETPPATCAPPTVAEHLVAEHLDFDTFKVGDKDLTLRGTSSKFVCSTSEESLIQAEYIYFNHSVTEEGILIGVHPTEEGNLNVINHTHHQFCLVYTETGEENDTVVLSTKYLVCTKNTKADDKDFTMIFYPCALLISSVFLLLTVVSYLLDPDLHRPLFGKITLGFIVNLLFTYVFLATGYITRNTSSVLSLLSVPCVMLGYVTIYFFFSFMFWINAMAASICLKFSAIMAAHSDNERKKFIINFVYAQGLPLILCLIIYLIDSYGSCDWIRPDMGEAQCFIGSPRMEIPQQISYMKTAEFIYFQGILLVLQITNIIFFLVTVYFLIDHWRTASNLTKTGENRGNFLIVVKLFFIMGIPWIGELLSHSITHIMGAQASFYYRITLDCSNLFTGVLVFLVLICKEKTVKRVRSRLQRRSQLSRGSTLTTSTKDTVNWYRDKDSTHREPRGEELRLQVFFRQKHFQTTAPRGSSGKSCQLEQQQFI